MSTPPEIDSLPSQLAQLTLRLERCSAATISPEPDFLNHAKAIWGEKPAGMLLSDLLSETRG